MSSEHEEPFTMSFTNAEAEDAFLAETAKWLCGAFPDEFRVSPQEQVLKYCSPNTVAAGYVDSRANKVANWVYDGLAPVQQHVTYADYEAVSFFCSDIRPPQASPPILICGCSPSTLLTGLSFVRAYGCNGKKWQPSLVVLICRPLGEFFARVGLLHPCKRDAFARVDLFHVLHGSRRMRQEQGWGRWAHTVYTVQTLRWLWAVVRTVSMLPVWRRVVLPCNAPYSGTPGSLLPSHWPPCRCCGPSPPARADGSRRARRQGTLRGR